MLDAANLAYRYTQNMEGSWSVPNALFNSQWGEDNPDWLQSVESPLYGKQAFEDVVTVLAPLPERDGQKIGFRCTSHGDYLVVQPKVTPGAEERAPTYLRVAAVGFDLIQETDLGTPDPTMTGASSRGTTAAWLWLTRWALYTWADERSVGSAGSMDRDFVERGGVLGPPVSTVLPAMLPASGEVTIG